MEDRVYSVYKHVFPNGKIYVGITCQRLKTRWKRGYDHNPLMINAINKYGWENIRHKVLKQKFTEQEAKDKEIELIAKYRSTERDFGYNLTSGGEGYRAFGKNNHMYGKHLSEQAKLKLKQAGLKNTGKDHPMYGTHRSEETKRKISKSLTGTMSPLKGKRLSEEHIQKLRDSHKGKPLSEEHRQKIAKSMKKYWSVSK